MLQSSRASGGPCHGVMELEEGLVQLRAELSRLQGLCAKQTRLLQQLMARKGPVLDVPMSLPVQCTEDMVMGEAGKPWESRRERSEALSSIAAGSSRAHVLPSCNVTDPPGTENGNGKAALDAPLGSQHCSQLERSGKEDLETWLKNYGMLPAVEGGRGEARACGDLPQLVAPDPEAVGSFLHLCEAPRAPQREDAPGDTALPAAIPVPVEIRGPTKTSWTPAWTLEESLGQGASVAPEPRRACGLCQAAFPSDTAAQGDYLKHLLAHMK